MKKLLICTGGGDCPGLNAVIRAIHKAATSSGEWEVYGSMEAFNGVLHEPQQVFILSSDKVRGIHVKGGTILQTTNKGNPLSFPIALPDGSVKFEDRSDELVKKIHDMGFDAVINIGGDGSQKISQVLFEKGVNIIGVPKTIDNDLSATDLTFGFQTAVQIATECFDKLVSTAESHHRVMIMEVMGRDAGWIALHTAIAGGAEICLIPEIPYDLNKVLERIESRYQNGKGFVNIVVAEGAKSKEGTVTGVARAEVAEHLRLGGVAYKLSHQLKEIGCQAEIRETVLGHIQRGGTPIAFDRVLATMFGVKAFELVQKGDFGKMVSFKNNDYLAVDLKEATKDYNTVDRTGFLVNAAKAINISFGD
jgi:ATP-dependent phosphofructokinase / diphosphate-dependent phosphofructokinase